jgi:hypothetical protein
MTKTLLRFMLLAGLALCPAFSQTIRIHGKVVDFKTGEALAKALVSIRSQNLDAVTDDSGQFELRGVQPGEVEIYVGTVGYGLLKKKMQLPPGLDQELELQIGEEALKRSDQVTVASGPFEAVEPNAPTERTLHSTDLKNLSSGLFADPVRSVQTLPGVAAGDDFYAEFAVRGAGIAHIGFFLDGVLIKDPFHSIQQVTDFGSVSLLSGDFIESISLLDGGIPAMYGDRTGAILNVQTREAGREKIFTRINVDCFGASITAEGPLDRGKKASWLVTARKSYLQYLLKRMDTNGLAIGYYDMEGKLTYDPARGHRLSLLTIHGPGAVDETNRTASRVQVQHTRSGVDVARTGWQWTPRESAILRTVLYYYRETGLNRNGGQELLLDSKTQDLGFRHDAAIQIDSHYALDAGVEVQRNKQTFVNYYTWNFATALPGPNLVPVADFSAAAWKSSVYVQNAWSALGGRLSLIAGGRFDRFSYTHDRAWSPRASLSLALASRTKLTAAYGRYSQFPDFEQLLGAYYNPNLRAERATHYDIGFEQLLSNRTRFRMELYDRQENRVVYSPDTEWRLAGSQALWPHFGPVLRDSTTGYSRGIEFTIERRSANRLSGWVSYSYGHARYRDEIDRLSFDGDFDQRHTVNAYATYRLSKTINLSGKYRYGSDFPLVGFYKGDIYTEAQRFTLASGRNLVRMAPYNRLDTRLNKACFFKRSKLTLYVEVDNMLNRRNRRYGSLSSYDFGTGQAWLNWRNMLPILPSGGFTVEF